MAFDFSKLKGKIKEIFGTQQAFAEALDLSNASMSARLNNVTGWSQEEILNACELLKISSDEMYVYFFTLEVRKTE